MNGELVGLQQLLKKFKKMNSVVQGEIILNALQVGALVITNEAKILAPYKTGTLRRSIHVGGDVGRSAPGFTPNDEAGIYSDLGPDKDTKFVKSVKLGTNLVYAKFQEYGTARGLPARPFMRPAFDSKINEATKTISKAIKTQIDKVK